MSKEKFEQSISKTEKTARKVRNIGWFFVGLGFLILIIGFFYWLSFEGKLNEVGDFVGGIAGSLWTLAGLFFIYVAFLGQKIEIKYQQEELKLNREELRESKEVFKAQANIMLDQKLDTTFFNLLDNHRKLVDSFKKGNSKQIGRSNGFFDYGNKITETVSGYEVLERIYKPLKNYLFKYSNYLKSRNIFDSQITRSNPIKAIKEYGDIELLYNEVSGIIEFISNKIRKENREFYLNTLFNNLSNEEKFLLTLYNINVSNHHKSELDFENYLSFEFKDFSKEKSFLSSKNFFFKKYNLKKKDDERIMIKIIDENPNDYSQFNFYLLDEEEKQIIHVKRIELIQQEIPIYNSLLDITKKHFSDKILEKVKDKNSRQEYNIILEGKNKIHNFNMYDSYNIKIDINNEKLELYEEQDTNLAFTWVQDHFNNLEN